MEDYKYCPSCRENKSIENFHKEGRVKSNGEPKRRRHCADCVAERKRIKRLADKKDGDARKQDIFNALLNMSRHEIGRLEVIDEVYFCHKTSNAEQHLEGLDFDQIKDEVREHLVNSGMHHDQFLNLGEGKYLIVGDSHGNHTRRGIIDLVSRLNDELDISKVIHIGHFVDDDNHINPFWSEIKNMILLVKNEEVRVIQECLDYFEEKECFDYEFSFEIIRDEIILGNYSVVNQDFISDYVRTFIGNLDSVVFPNPTITNLHRHEMHSRTTHHGQSIIASPGCLCEKHIIRTIKQIDFVDGKSGVKVAYPDSFSKYRRMRHLYEFWEQGAILVDVDSEGEATIHPMRIRNVDGEYCTSYFNKIYTESGVFEPDQKIYLTADAHADYHDEEVYAVSEKICRDYKPNTYVDLGDIYKGGSVNHHAMSRGEVIETSKEDMLREVATVQFLLHKTSDWADEKYVLFGNHERFLNDFVSKNPQFQSLFDFEFLTNLKAYGFKLVEFKDVLELGGCKFLHGDIKMYGQGGRKNDQISRVFGKSSVSGHCHYPSIRLGCYTIGLSGQLDQRYNEPNASQWVHGVGFCNVWKGEPFVTTIPLDGKKARLNGKLYSADESEIEKWRLPEYKVRLSYEFSE